MEKRNIGVGLMGLGVIGGQVARVLLERGKSLSQQVGMPIVLRKIKILEQDLSYPQAKEMEPGLLTTDEDEFFNTPGIDIVVELIGGEEPAFDYQKIALTTGKHVITANKEVIAKHGAELAGIAQNQNVSLNYEAAVGGGVPLIKPFERDLVANKIKGIYAIINGTTNFILTRMAREGVDFEVALKQAQHLGYAEADPKNDIEGIDSKYKLAILASLAFQSWIHPNNIYCEGVSRLSSRDFRYAREMGYAIKLLAIAKQSNESIEVRVHPVCLPEDDFLAKVDGVYNAILVEGDLVGKVTFLGEGAGPLPTSSAVAADIVQVARNITLGADCRSVLRLQSGRKIKKMPDIVTRYFIRMNIVDQAGVLAQIARILGDNNISIASAIQKEADKVTKTAEIVIMTYPSPEKGIIQAVDKLNHLGVVKEVNNFIRVEV
ncbi:MAG: homoserine dehydrogenase [Dehalococcoidia bacterium]|nr:MAG: homoserine dehydrogenase [Dehalococcoidia bacterium]